MSTDTKSDRRRKLNAFLGDLGKAETLALVSDLLSIDPFDNKDVISRLSPNERRKATFDLLIRHLILIAASNRVLVLFEDIHWADASTLELLDLLISQLDGHPILLVATYRPEFQASWAGQSQVSVITLARLPAAQQRRLIEAVAGSDLLSPRRSRRSPPEAMACRYSPKSLRKRQSKSEKRRTKRD